MEELRNELLEVINHSQLPAECIYYIFKDIFRDIQEQYTAMLQQAEAAKASAQRNIEVEEIPPQSQIGEEVK